MWSSQRSVPLVQQSYAQANPSLQTSKMTHRRLLQGTPCNVFGHWHPVRAHLSHDAEIVAITG